MMLFEFLKYLQPVHYFQLYRKSGKSIFPVVSYLPSDIIEQLGVDTSFESNQAQDYDLSWRAIQLGYIGDAKTYSTFSPQSRKDNYRFIRKYFHQAWVLYVLLLRILSFKNPLKELNAWWLTRKTKNFIVNEEFLQFPKLENFQSQLLKENPKISIIIPTLNRYNYLKDVFKDLEKQTYKNFEVIVVDQTEPFQEEIYKNWNFDLKYWYQKDKALWKARNEAIISSKSEYLLLYDDDSLVEPSWIENHLIALDFFKADISSGVSISTIKSHIPENYKYFRISDQLDTGNVLIKKEVFEEIGLFDRQFEKQRMGDGEYGLRAFLAGFKNISNPKAKRIHLKVGQGGFRDLGTWDGWRSKKLFAPRPVPSVLYLYRSYFGNNLTRMALLRSIPISVFPYQFKKNKLLLIIGVVITLLAFPLVITQIIKSWKLSSKKIKDGPIIDTL